MPRKTNTPELTKGQRNQRKKLGTKPLREQRERARAADKGVNKSGSRSNP
jgi:hypothetical protein